jgi:NTE family protein
MASDTTPRKRIGLALGSGSARGAVHIGVIEELRRHGIEAEIIAGTSIGALVGACEALGELDRLAEFMSGLGTREVLRYLDVKVLASGGVGDGERLMSHLRATHGDHLIENLGGCFAAVAADVYRGREVWLQRGDLWDAVRASIAIPGIMTPVNHDHHWLSDGALVNPVPVSVCRALGADFVIAINPNFELLRWTTSGHGTEVAPEVVVSAALPPDVDDSETPEAHFFDRVAASLRDVADPMRKLWSSGDESHSPGTLNVMLSALNVMQDRITRSRLAGDPPDIMLNPRLGRYSFMDFSECSRLIEEGHACVRRSLAQIRYSLDMEEIPHRIAGG